jgi:hypothetical protein
MSLETVIQGAMSLETVIQGAMSLETVIKGAMSLETVIQSAMSLETVIFIFTALKNLKSHTFPLIHAYKESGSELMWLLVDTTWNVGD